MPTRRNPVARYGALLRKGGVHTESVSGKRHQSKRQLDDEIDEYLNQREKAKRKTGKGRNDSAPSSKFHFRFPVQMPYFRRGRSEPN